MGPFRQATQTYEPVGPGAYKTAALTLPDGSRFVYGAFLTQMGCPSFAAVLLDGTRDKGKIVASGWGEDCFSAHELDTLLSHLEPVSPHNETSNVRPGVRITGMTYRDRDGHPGLAQAPWSKMITYRPDGNGSFEPLEIIYRYHDYDPDGRSELNNVRVFDARGNLTRTFVRHQPREGRRTLEGNDWTAIITRFRFAPARLHPTLLSAYHGRYTKDPDGVLVPLPHVPEPLLWESFGTPIDLVVDGRPSPALRRAVSDWLGGRLRTTTGDVTNNVLPQPFWSWVETSWRVLRSKALAPIQPDSPPAAPSSRPSPATELATLK